MRPLRRYPRQGTGDHCWPERLSFQRLQLGREGPQTIHRRARTLGESEMGKVIEVVLSGAAPFQLRRGTRNANPPVDEQAVISLSWDGQRIIRRKPEAPSDYQGV